MDRHYFFFGIHTMATIKADMHPDRVLDAEEQQKGHSGENRYKGILFHKNAR